MRLLEALVLLEVRETNMTYQEALKRIIEFESTGVLYEWMPQQEEDVFDDAAFKKLPPSRMGFKADIISFTYLYHYEIREQTTHLPRKKKKKLALHFNKKYNKLKRFVDAMEE